MSTLKNEILKLLDRVYNLKSDDNEIIANISKDIENTENDIHSNDDYRVTKEKEKSDLEGRLKTFEDQKELFLNTFSDVDNSVFASLKEIEIDFDVEDMVSKVKRNAPKYEEDLNTEISNTNEEIERKLQSNRDLNSKLEVLNKDKEKAEADKNRLMSLFEQGLSTEEIERDSLSKKYVQDILSSPGVFTNNEIQEITKLLMFPEDGLYEYDKNYEDRKSNGFPTSDMKLENDEVEQIISLIEEKENEPVKEIYAESEKTEEPTEEPTEEVHDEAPAEEEPPVEEEKVEETPVEEPQEEVEEQPTEEETVELVEEPVEEESVEEESVEEESVEEEPVAEETTEEVHDEAPAGEETPVEEETTEEVQEPEIEESTEETKEELEYNREQIKDIEKQATQILDLSSLNPQEDKVVELSSEEPEAEEQPQENPFEEKQEEVVEEKVVENSDAPDEESIQEFLEEMDLDLNKFRTYNNASIDEVMAFLNGADRSLIKENYEILRSINIDEETIYQLYDNHMYLTDPELNLKLTLLRSKTISDKKLKELIENNTSGLREEYETIQNRIKLMEKYKNEINEDNINLINKDFVKYDENIKNLTDNGFDFDEKETRNYEGLLFASNHIEEDSEILKNYLVRIIRKNGKYALELFWKDSKDLMFGIDDLIENDLSELINNNPEALGLNTDEIISRVKTCEKNGFPVNEGNDGTVFSKYILDFQEFAKKLEEGNINTDLDHLPSRSEVNLKIPTIIGNQGSNLVDILDNYYKNTKLFKDIELTGTAKELYAKLANSVETKLNAKVSNKYTYNIGDSWISKIKFERNLAIIIDKLNQDDNLSDVNEKELILTSILYNLRQDEGTLKKVASSYVESAE